MDFEEKFNKKLVENKIYISQEQIYKFKIYYKLLLEYNKKFNLTSITDEEDVMVKHFIDSIKVLPYIKGKTVIDIGTGAGFPGIPLKILEDFDMILVDSVNKKIEFLNIIISQLGLKNIRAIHSRIEDLSNNTKFREKFDVCVSRAVAPLNTLAEYALPFCKVGGKFLAFKGPNAEEELEKARFAIERVGGQVSNIYNLKFENVERNILEIKKILKTPSEFPRIKNLPRKQPL